MRFIQDHSIIHPLQSGNRKSHSTETALLHFSDEILKNMDEKRISVVVLLDMTVTASVRIGMCLEILCGLIYVTAVIAAL